jgi:hypothetical protein
MDIHVVKATEYVNNWQFLIVGFGRPNQRPSNFTCRYITSFQEFTSLRAIQRTNRGTAAVYPSKTKKIDYLPEVNSDELLHGRLNETPVRPWIVSPISSAMARRTPIHRSDKSWPWVQAVFHLGQVRFGRAPLNVSLSRLLMPE